MKVLDKEKSELIEKYLGKHYVIDSRTTQGEIELFYISLFEMMEEQEIKALTFAYNKFPTGKNLGEIIKDWKEKDLNLNK